MRQQHMEQKLDQINNLLIAFARAKIGYKELAKFLVEDVANEAYGKNLNQSIGIEINKKASEDAQKEKEAAAAEAAANLPKEVFAKPDEQPAAK